MEIHHVARTSTADEVAKVLRQRILSGQLRPGSTLLEIPLSAALGVSRNTMREAMRIRSLEGLLKRRIHRGITVAELSPFDVAEIYSLRRMLESEAVRCVNRATEDDFKRMDHALADFEAAATAAEWVKAVDADLRFHRHLVSLHASPRLQSFYEKLIGELRLGMVLVDRQHDNPSRLIPQHLEILDLLRSKRVEECSECLFRHLDDSESRLRSIFEHPEPASEIAVAAL